jgi:putative Mg2+ transporter-C (MgtC) family protein
MPVIFETINNLMKFGPAFFIQTLIAALCGLAIGIERERKQKPAGYRTIVLITSGSCLFTLISYNIPVFLGLTNSDPTRIAAQIVTGIGFLGAGTIIQSGGNILGLTTSAVIWVMAAIGMIIGFGFPIIGVILTLMILLFLLTSYRIETLVMGKCHFSNLEITFKDNEMLKKTILTILMNNDIDISRFKLVIKEKELILRIKYCDLHLSHHKFLAEIYNLGGIKEIESIDEKSLES